MTTWQEARVERPSYERAFSIRFFLRWIPKNPWVLADRRLEPYLDAYLGDGPTARVLDVAAGAVPHLGSQHPTKAVDVVSCDMLAEDYRVELTKAGLIPWRWVEPQNAECLTYDAGSFDVVHCSNGLDHMLRPATVLSEMTRVCRPGGWVYLRHHRNVGIKEGYRGMHAWNIHELPDGDCLFGDRFGAQWTIREVLPSSETVRRMDRPGASRLRGTMVVTTWQKPMGAS